MTTIRKAEPGDAPALVELGTEVGNEPGGWLITANGWRSAGDERRYLRALRRYPHAAVYVAEDEGRIVGRLSIARDQHPASYHVADLGLMVAATHRRRGIGRALLAAAHERAGKRLRIMNIDDRQAGIAAFLEKCGAQKMVRQIEMVIAPRAGAANSVRAGG